jgi:hypothetical protein
MWSASRTLGSCPRSSSPPEQSSRGQLQARARKDIAAFGQLFNLTGNNSVDVAARFGKLVEIRFKRSAQNIPALRQFFPLAPATRPSMLARLSARLSRSARSASERAVRPDHERLTLAVESLLQRGVHGGATLRDLWKGLPARPWQAPDGLPPICRSATRSSH